MVQVGEEPSSRFRVVLKANNPEALLEWALSSPDVSDLEKREGRSVMSLPFYLADYTPFRISMEVTAGRPSSATVSTPIIWNEAIDDPLAVASKARRLAALGDQLLLTADPLAYSIDAAGAVTAAPSFEDWVSEIRVWDQPDGSKGLGVCMPDANQLLLGEGSTRLVKVWSKGLRKELGPFIGEEAGFMSHPLSFDVGPDGRIYVLEAGDMRVLVFDAERNYLTQWGRKGSDPGEFDLGDSFGSISSPLGMWDFTGSIVVDDDGYIYVADVGNRRIQKFAP